MYTTESTSSAFSESTLDTINSAGSTVLRINSTAHMRHTKDQHSSSNVPSYVSFQKTSQRRHIDSGTRREGELLLKFKAAGLTINLDTSL